MHNATNTYLRQAMKWRNQSFPSCVTWRKKKPLIHYTNHVGFFSRMSLPNPQSSRAALLSVLLPPQSTLIWYLINSTIGRDTTVHHAHHPPPPKPKIVPHVEEIESSEDEEENDPLASLTPMFPTNVREVRKIIRLNIWVLTLPLRRG